MSMAATVPQDTRPARRSRVKHRAILDAAGALAAERPFAEITIEAIAERAGVGKQTIYRWWPSKPALMVEVYTDLVPAGPLDLDRGSVRADLRGLLVGLFDRLTATPAGRILAGLLVQSQTDAAAMAAVTDGLVVGRRILLHQPIRRGIARGELPLAFDADWAVDGITARIWHALLLDPQRLTAAFADRLVDEVLR